MEINIILREMNKTRFDEYCDASIREYAEDLIKSGSASSENVMQLAQKDFDDILPNGYSTPNASIFSVSMLKTRMLA